MAICVKRVIVTEKTTILNEDRNYVFEVPENANKVEIKKHFEKVLGIKNIKVNTKKKITKGGRKNTKNGSVYMIVHNVKMAYVKLPEGAVMNFNLLTE